MRTLTIVIPYFKGVEFLLQCLGSISSTIGNKDVRARCLIIDNGTTVPALPDYRDQLHVEIIQTKYKLGFGRAVNIGIHRALKVGSDYILVTNQDTIFAEKSIEELVRQADQYQDCFLFPVVKERDFSDAPEWYADKYLGGIDIANLSETTVDVAHQNAICFIGSNKAFTKAGYFDPSYFMYFEDDDYFNRYKKKGGRLVLVKTSVVGHYFEMTSVAKAQRESHIWYRNARIRHFARYKSTGEFWGAWTRTTIGSIIKLRLKRLYIGLMHDMSMLRQLEYVRKINEEKIESAARRAIGDDLLKTRR